MATPLTDVWSGYSLLKSLWTVEDLVKTLAARGFEAALLADWETLAGVEEFDRRMRSAGLFPLVGVTRTMMWQGVEREIRLVARTPQAWSGIVRFGVWNGDSGSGTTVVLGSDLVPWWQEIEGLLGDDVVVELEAGQRDFVERLPSAWRWVPSRRIRFRDERDRGVHQLLAQIGGFPADPTAQALPESPESWWGTFADWPQGQVWRPTDFGSVFARHIWKIPRLPNVDDEDAELCRLAEAGLSRRHPEGVQEAERMRLRFELSVIRDLGFSGYFLMVGDVVNWAKTQNIRVGPGRGSAAGSLVSYALGITDVNPMKYGLVFERFLNPYRRTLPDIDLDFEDTRRGEVIQYLRERHGLDRVAQIGTYGTLGARAALRDVGRVTGLPLPAVSQVVKSVEWGLGDRLVVHADALRAASLRVGIGTGWIDQALKLEGLPRHRSTHAAGVIIAPGPLQEVLYCHGNAEDGWTTDFDMESVEQLGFVKLDVLGLRTLTTLAKMEGMLGRNPADLGNVDGHDNKTLRLLGRGDTDGIFQLDGRGVKTLLRQMRPRSAEEVMLVVALYRPGPMDSIGDFLRRRAENYRPAPDDALESLLTDTFGIMVYQEQLMAAVQHVAGLSLAEADLIRRAVSKKDHAMLTQEGERLLANMAERGLPLESARLFWERIRAFGDYGFNKSHAASYGLLAYYLAYLKANHPLEFWAAELSSHENGERLKELMIQAVSQGIPIAPPHVNESGVAFAPQGERGLRASLTIIRGVGVQNAERIVQAREDGGLFASAVDLSRRLSRGPVSRILEALGTAGALAGLGSWAGASQTQMHLFDRADSGTEMPPDYVSAFGFGWPVADGPVFVRAEDGVNRASLVEKIRVAAERLTGDVPVALIGERGRSIPVHGVMIRADWKALQTIKEMDGVQACGRHVSETARG